jgi:hypothetical protein
MIRQNSYPADRSDELHSALHNGRGQPRRHSALEPEWAPSNNGTSGAEQLSENADPPSKRRRVALACTVCRGRKSRVSNHHHHYQSRVPHCNRLTGVGARGANWLATSVRRRPTQVLTVHRARLRVCLPTILLVLEHHRWQGVSLDVRRGVLRRCGLLTHLLDTCHRSRTD